jgi:hypothetical protein
MVVKLFVADSLLFRRVGNFLSIEYNFISHLAAIYITKPKIHFL